MDFKNVIEPGYIIPILIILLAFYYLPVQSVEKIEPFLVESYHGSVVTVIDGDTIKICDSTGRYHTIRLMEIDAPELLQRSGKKAKKALTNKIHGRDVTVESATHDSYGRMLGKVYYQNRWINKEMLDEGWAWHFKWYSDNLELARAERIARETELGLWQHKDSTPPWEYRRIAKKF